MNYFLKTWVALNKKVLDVNTWSLHVLPMSARVLSLSSLPLYHDS